MKLEDRQIGVLLGTAIGDALGLACEGLSRQRIKRWLGVVERYHFFGKLGVVSDDTEQSALVVQALLTSNGDEAECERRFRRAMAGWFLRLPWGIGWSTLRACIRLCVGIKKSGRPSAGNGAAMRSAPIGAFFHDEPELRRKYSVLIAKVTHTDLRGVDGAVFVAELASQCIGACGKRILDCFDSAVDTGLEKTLVERLVRARELALSDASAHDASEEIGVSGFVLESVPWAAFCFLRFGIDPMKALSECVGAGGDTDSNAAILGSWLGAFHGCGRLPEALIANLLEGPFGRSHLQALGRAMSKPAEAPGYSWPVAFLRNLAFYPVVLGHGVRRLIL